MEGKKMAVLSLVGILLIAGAFYAGLRYERITGRTEKMTGLREGGASRQGMRPGGERNGSLQAGFVAGKVIAKDDKTITIKTKEGGSKIVYYSTSTTIGKIASGSADDLLIGQSVIVNGSGGTDGSLSAQSIQIRPELGQ